MSIPNLRPGTYRHFKKGTIYQVQKVGRHSETMEYLVCYIGPDGQTWFRPYDHFISPAMLEDGTSVPRFVYQESEWD